ncbi:hypothetical protein CHS0354_019252 [Potamilus streckersoni]|uniref:RING-type E3 ubiquitin transferase n=1 Tax=Potamilus streckersoni TaxID=2493646 RepID=A0AAE0W4M0_9BIVA|nr:hypothetical protein CHS0354_019252 [Potamilus streckersoni]
MENSDNLCFVCHEHIDVFAIGKCDHPICFKCSTRMRALYKQFECPICRTYLPKVFFLRKREKYGEMLSRKYLIDRECNIYFENPQLEDRFLQLLEHSCHLCKDRYPDRDFKALQAHMRKEHSLFYCDLCLDNLKIFTQERKVYNRHDLGVHRRVGDKDDKSYKGHPLCEFCDVRYMDKDELYKHLRKDHYFCHFCDADGIQDYYSDYIPLKQHFREQHFLCEDDECATNSFEHAFRSEIDLRAHRAIMHSKALSKAQVKQERTLPVDFKLPPRSRNRDRGVITGQDYEEIQRNQGGSRRYNRENYDLQRALTQSVMDMKQDKQKSSKDLKADPKVAEDGFPSLSGDNLTRVPDLKRNSDKDDVKQEVGSSMASHLALANSMSVQHGMLHLNDFPSLHAENIVPNVKSDSEKTYNQSSSGRNSPYTSVTSVNKKHVDDFPELPAKFKQTNDAPLTSSTWGKNNKKSTGHKTLNEKFNKKPKSDSQKPLTIQKTFFKNTAPVLQEEDFPSLSSSTQPASNNSSWNKSSLSSSSSCTLKAVQNGAKISSVNNHNTEKNFEDSKERTKKKNKKKKNKGNNDGVEKLKENFKESVTSSLENIASSFLENRPEKTSKYNKVLDNDVKSMIQKKDLYASEVERNLVTKDADLVPVVKNAEIVQERLHQALPLEAKGEDKVQLIQASNEEVLLDKEFPSLLATVKPTKPPPPGFKFSVHTPGSKAPPGFGSVSSQKTPPPGFSVQPNTASEGKTLMDIGIGTLMPMLTDIVKFEYRQPDEFQDRNIWLISEIKHSLDSDSSQFGEFKSFSADFRRGDMHAEEYYRRCESLLGKKKFALVFPELLALLPDIEKQQELLTVYMQMEKLISKDKGSDILKISTRSSNSRGSWSMTLSGFLTCQTCRQVLVRKDYNSHVKQHNLDTDFPSLHSDSEPVSQRLGLEAWVKAK